MSQPKYCAEGARRLVIRCRHRRGQKAEWKWWWPGDEARASFAEILGANDQLESGESEQLEAVLLYCAGSAHLPAWWMRNQSRELKCTVNDANLAYGQQIRLQSGDEIEVGLTHFSVDFEVQGDDDLVAYATDDERETATEPERERPEPDLIADFNLADLARLHGDSEGANLIAGIADTSPVEPTDPVNASAQTQVVRIQAEESGQRNDAHTVAAKHGGHTLAGPDRSADDHASVWLRDDANLEAADDVREAEILEDAVMTSLHRQYLKTLQDPYHREDGIDWAGIEQGTRKHRADELNYWMGLATGQSGLNDLLDQSRPMHDVINGFDPLESAAILNPEPYPDVMRLFAPESSQNTGRTQSPILQALQVPSLTRREHHSISIDSMMPAAPDVVREQPARVPADNDQSGKE